MEVETKLIGSLDNSITCFWLVHENEPFNNISGSVFSLYNFKLRLQKKALTTNSLIRFNKIDYLMKYEAIEVTELLYSSMFKLYPFAAFTTMKRTAGLPKFFFP